MSPEFNFTEHPKNLQIRKIYSLRKLVPLKYVKYLLKYQIMRKKNKKSHANFFKNIFLRFTLHCHIIFTIKQNHEKTDHKMFIVDRELYI